MLAAVHALLACCVCCACCTSYACCAGGSWEGGQGGPAMLGGKDKSGQGGAEITPVVVDPSVSFDQVGIGGIAAGGGQAVGFGVRAGGEVRG